MREKEAGVDAFDLAEPGNVTNRWTKRWLHVKLRRLT